jgi:hypothetical protein
MIEPPLRGVGRNQLGWRNAGDPLPLGREGGQKKQANEIDWHSSCQYGNEDVKG